MIRRGLVPAPSITRRPGARALVLAVLLPIVGAGMLAAGDVCAAEPGSAGESTPVHIPAGIPVRRSAERSEAGSSSLRGVVIGITMLVAIAVMAARLKKARLGPRTDGGGSAWFGLLARGPRADGLRVLESVRLTPKSSLHVVRWDGRELLVGCGDTGIAVLGSRVQPSELPAPVEAGTAGSKG